MGRWSSKPTFGSYWAELNAGVTWQISRVSAIFANVGYQRTLDRDTHAWTGKFGVRFNW